MCSARAAQAGKIVGQVPDWVYDHMGADLASKVAEKMKYFQIDAPLLKFFDHDSWKKLGVDDALMRCRLLRQQLHEETNGASVTNRCRMIGSSTETEQQEVFVDTESLTEFETVTEQGESENNFSSSDAFFLSFDAQNLSEVPTDPPYPVPKGSPRVQRTCCEGSFLEQSNSTSRCGFATETNQPAPSDLKSAYGEHSAQPQSSEKKMVSSVETS